MARRRYAALLAAALLLGLWGCRQAAPIAAKPALYRLADADTVIWMIGTVHALPPGVQWETPAIRAAERAADTLVTELPELAPAVAAGRFAVMANASGLPPILARVPADKAKPLAALATRAGLSLHDLDGMKSWAAALTLSAAAARVEAGATPADGVEAVISTRMAGRRRLAFESLSEQLHLFDRLNERDQRQLLSASITAGASFRETLNAWAAGDEQRLADLVARPLRRAPGIEAALLTRRNARWSAWIAQRMGQPGTVLVAVGAGHLAGPKSAIALLRARGLKVQRLQ